MTVHPAGLCRILLPIRLEKARVKRARSPRRVICSTAESMYRSIKVKVGESPVVEVADHGSEKPGGLERGRAERLHVIFQPGGQIEVLDQLPDLKALLLDDPGQTPLLFGQGRVLLQIAGVAHNQREGGADVVGDSADPGRAGIIPLIKLLSLADQKGGGLV